MYDETAKQENTVHFFNQHRGSEDVMYLQLRRKSQRMTTITRNCSNCSNLNNH